MTADFEKLGAFYLGKTYDPQSAEVRDELLLYDAKDLTTHAVCVGMTGSGKTGLCVSLLEEAAIDGIPAIVIDPKGDLGNLALRFPELRPEDFEPYIDAGEAKRKGRTVQAHAEATAELWRNGLASWGQDGERIRRFRDGAEIAFYTPGSQNGRPISALRSLAAPSEATLEDPDAMREQVLASVSSLLALLGIEADPIRSREHILLSNILHHAWEQGQDVELGDLIRQISDPPFTRVGVMELETFYKAKDRADLAMRVNSILASPGFSAWMEGEPLNIGRLLRNEDGKPRISIMSIAHLDDAQRMFFVTLLLNEVVAWMRSQPGTSTLRAILYMDEVFGFLPPVANPPSKGPMLTLLKQARAFGLGVVMATQNPVDVDYKALSNCGTWLLGRLQTQRDVGRVLDGLAGAATSAGQEFDRGAMERTLGGLKSRVFVMNNVHESAPALFHTRWALSYLRGPLTRKQIRELAKGEQEGLAAPASQSRAATAQRARDASLVPGAPVAAAAGAAAAGAAVAAVASQAAATEQPAAEQPVPQQYQDGTGPRPMLSDSLTELFMGGTPGCRYRPGLLATVSLHYSHRYSHLDEWVEPTFIVPTVDVEVGTAWREAGVHDASSLPLLEEPPGDARFFPLDGPMDSKRMTSLKRSLKTHVYKNHAVPIYRCAALKLWSEPGEDQAAFVGRVQLLSREKRDEAVQKLQKRYVPKLDRLQTRIRKAEQKVEREKSQVSQRQMDAAVNVGTTIMGALFGRKSTAGAGRSIKSAGRISQEKQQVRQAEEDLASLREELDEMEAEFEQSVAELKADRDSHAPEVEVVQVRPKKTDITIVRAAIVWLQC